MFKGLRILVCCNNCGKIKTLSQFKYDKSKTKNFYCNNKCRLEKIRNTIIIKCDQCGKSKEIKNSEYLKYKNHFCNKTCHRKWKIGKNIGENHPNFGNFIVNCAWCNTSKRVNKAEFEKDKKHFCNRKCLAKYQSKYQSKENASNWQGGIDSQGYDGKFPKYLKKQIKERDKNTCQICHSTNKRLNVHHIDYNKHNNKKDNLITLCASCHGKTNFNREDWQELLEFYMEEKFSNFKTPEEFVKKNNTKFSNLLKLEKITNKSLNFPNYYNYQQQITT